MAASLTRRKAAESLSAGPRWQEPTLTDRVSIGTDDLRMMALVPLGWCMGRMVTVFADACL